ncbi:MAG TPA: hypothetical protein VEC75_10235 [Stellaceae bacterium]|nr:hypothetical protein [Stellaceae bacterium]
MQRAVSIARATSPASGWLRGGALDAGLLLGIPGLAILCGAVALADRRFLLPVLIADLWLLGHRHLVESQSRLRGGRDGSGWFRLALAGLPLLLVAIIGAIALGGAAWVPATVYFYWQWFQSTGQSWATLQLYRRRAPRGADLGDHSLLAALFCLTPIWGLLRRSAEAPVSFLGLDLHLLAVPETVAAGAGIAACGAFCLWIVERAIAWSEQRLPLAQTLYVLSHLAVFAVAYGLISDITVGWLVAAIWSHAQFLVLAWLRHGADAANPREPRARLLARLVARRQLGLYTIVALASAAAALFGEKALAIALPAAAFLYLALDLQRFLLELRPRRRMSRRTATA